MARIVKKEVKELCVKFCNSEIGSQEWEELKRILEQKYKFTPWNLLALYGNPPTIEYNDNNFGLVTEEIETNGQV
jgi:hypothetical protein